MHVSLEQEYTVHSGLDFKENVHRLSAVLIYYSYVFMIYLCFSNSVYNERSDFSTQTFFLQCTGLVIQKVILYTCCSVFKSVFQGNFMTF